MIIYLNFIPIGYSNYYFITRFSKDLTQFSTYLEEVPNTDTIGPYSTTPLGPLAPGPGSALTAAVGIITDLPAENYLLTPECPNVVGQETVKSSGGGGGFSQGGTGFGIDKVTNGGGEDFDSSSTLNITLTEA